MQTDEKDRPMTYWGGMPSEKLQSDTPRVDALDFGDQSIFPGPGYGALWALARQLERELAEARQMYELERAARDENVAGWMEKCRRLEAAQSATPESGREAQLREVDRVLEAICAASGYERWWIAKDKLFFERAGEPGYIQVLLVEKAAVAADNCESGKQK